MPHDEPELCCAMGLCCDQAKRRAVLAKMLKQHVANLSAAEATAVANFIHNEFDLLAKSLGFGPAFQKFAEMAREHPYE